MKPFKKILVPVDFSPHSAEALRYAADLSKRYGAALEIIHVYQVVNYAAPEGFVLYSPNQFAILLDHCEQQLKAAKADAEVAGGQDVKTELLQGDPFAEIVDRARAGAHDLIVMGTHGRTGISHALMGSVAEKVVRKSPCPVLTVKQAE